VKAIGTVWKAYGASPRCEGPDQNQRGEITFRLNRHVPRAQFVKKSADETRRANQRVIYRDRRGDEAARRRPQRKTEDLLLSASAVGRPTKRRTRNAPVRLAGCASADKAGTATDLQDRVKCCSIEGRPKIDEKRSDDNARPALLPTEGGSPVRDRPLARPRSHTREVWREKALTCLFEVNRRGDRDAAK